MISATQIARGSLLRPGVPFSDSLVAQEVARIDSLYFSIGVLSVGMRADTIRRADGVLTLPERVVYSENDSTWVEVAGADGARVRTPIATGLSDAIRVEVVSGLAEGQEVLEKPEKTL